MFANVGNIIFVRNKGNKNFPQKDKSMTTNKKLQKCLECLDALGWNCYYVGGCVRDEIMGRPCDDIDICVVGAPTLITLRWFVAQYADNVTDEVGNSFGVLIADFGGEKIDFALARTEKSTGDGHTDFIVSTENVTIEDDLGRRDLTINAIAKRCIDGEIVDPFGGVQDIETGIARPCTDAFMDDPLRVFRAARFISRFNLRWTNELEQMCCKADVTALPGERVGMELKKMFEQACVPSRFFDFLWHCNKLDFWFPEFAILDRIEQDPTWHPEGNAMIHTMMCMDQTTDAFTRCVMLCHDLGKATTTEYIDGRWKAPGHAKAGVTPTLSMLQRIKFMDAGYQKKVACLVEEHMFHTNQTFTRRAVIRCMRRLQKGGCTFDQLVEVCRCDVSGRAPLPGFTPYIGQDIAEDVVLKDATTRIVTGGVLIDLGYVPGPEMGKLLALLEEMQDEGTLTAENWKSFL